MKHLLKTAALLALVSPVALAAQVVPTNSAPTAVFPTDTIPAPRDVPYPGVIRLNVDASDTVRSVMKIRETIPVAQAGRLTLLLPEWLPGHHGPDGQIDKIAAVEFFGNGQKLVWTRDPVDVYAFHVTVPEGVREVEARFNYLSPITGSQGRVVMTPKIVNVQWGAVSLYPAGHYTRQIPIAATLTLPAGWKAGSALKQTQSGNTVSFEQVNYEILQDSPLFAGLHSRMDDLGNNVRLFSVADEAKDLEIPADVLAKHKAMAAQNIKVFGSKPFDQYTFLNAVSDELGGIGLEHHRSTEITTDPGYYTDYANHLYDRNVFPHEFTHSWDGKYRRGADHWTPDFRTPMRNSLLWVYEGQTQFWGTVVEARSGMSSKADVLNKIAQAAAFLDNQRGRDWRPLVDTTNDPIVQNRRPQPWNTLMRNEDYYNEGMLIWIEADAIIHAGTGGRKGMDDFAQIFFRSRDGDYGVSPYTRDDVIAAMNQVFAYDWATFFRDRVDVPTAHPPLEGLRKAGYALQWSDKPSSTYGELVKLRESDDFLYSLGFSVAGGKIGSIYWGSPGYNAALRQGDEIVAVGDKVYSNDALKEAVTAAKDGKTPIRLLIKRADRVVPYTVNYSGGLRYPSMVKIGKGTTSLDRLLTAR